MCENYYTGIVSNDYTKNNRLILKKGSNIDNRYEVVDILGSGSFSDVYLCTDHKYKSYVALKTIKRRKFYEKYSLIEYSLFKKIQKSKSGCVNIIKLYRYFDFNNCVFFSFEKHGISLYDYYKNENNIIDIKNFSKQILNGISYLHNLNIVHADLKPENILINNNILKIIDLGSSFESKVDLFYDYIQTRWYRAPEVLFNHRITNKIDIWSYGCILYELKIKSPLFGCKNENELREKILKTNDKVRYENYIYLPCDLELNSIVKLCLKFSYYERVSADKLIKDNYFLE